MAQLSHCLLFAGGLSPVPQGVPGVPDPPTPGMARSKVKRMAQDTGPLVGDTVTCTYRGDHRGVVLAVDDPSVWPGWSRSEIERHVGECQARGLLLDTVPVAWPWGVMWDRRDALHAIPPPWHRSEGMHVDYGPRGMVDYCDLDVD